MPTLGFLAPFVDKANWLGEVLSSPGAFDHVAFSRAIVLLAFLVYVLSAGFSIGGQLLRDRRWVVAARRAHYFGAGALVAASLGLIACFVTGEYSIAYVFNYSESRLPLEYKISGLWAGLDGSILFWATLVGIVSTIVARSFANEEEHPVGRRMEPNVLLTLALVQLFFLTVIAFVADPFSGLQEDLGANFAARFPSGVPTDGSGLNPQLVNYWMIIHPPCVYLGFVLYTVPFAYGVASLVTNEQGAYWVRKTRRWMLVAWLFNTSGIILGGLWAYEMLGWGGYWAWDPVENASFLPWFAATAFIHSIMLQERRDMLRGWNAFLVAFTFVLSLFGTYLTRSGIVSSVHAFASGEVGHWFLGFILVVVVTSIFMIALRSADLRSPNRVKSVFSREAVFVINNMILVAIPVALAILTLWPKLSFEFLGDQFTISVEYYNTVMNPFFIAMLAMLAIGPMFGWMSSKLDRVRRNALAPALVALPIAGLLHYAGLTIKGDDGPGLTFAEHLYPTFIVLYLGSFTIVSLAAEVLRAARNRVQRREQSWGAAIAHLLTRNNRRYGGYTVHIGLAILSIGIVSSSMFKTQREAILSDGETKAVGRYTLHVASPVEIRTSADRTTVPYQSHRLDVRVLEGPTVARAELEVGPDGPPTVVGGDPIQIAAAAVGGRFQLSPAANASDVDDGTELIWVQVEGAPIVLENAATRTPTLVAPTRDASGRTPSVRRITLEQRAVREIATVDPEWRFYPQNEFRRDAQGSTTPEILRFASEDLYLYWQRTGEDGRYRFSTFRNPLIALVWTGWIVMILGGLWAALPMGGRRVGLSE